MNNGSKIRISNLLRSLCRLHQVTLVSFYDSSESGDLWKLKEIGLEELEVVPYRCYRPLSGRALLGLMGPTPRSIVDTWSTQMEGVIREKMAGARYDLVVASQVWMAAYQDRFAGVPAIFEEVELGLFRDGHRHAPLGLRPALAALSWHKHRRFASRLVGKFAACTVVSEHEKNILREAVPAYGQVTVIPNGINMERFVGAALPRHEHLLIFAGSLGYLPNYEAMRWFLAEVYPIVKYVVPEARLTITGEVTGRALPVAPNVTMTGLLDDVRPLAASAAVSICPLLSGGGTRLKVLEAMALRTPVVATSKAVEGLAVAHDRHLLIADDARDFAEGVIRLLREPDLGRRLSEQAFSLMQETYDWKAIEPRWLGLVEQVARCASPTCADSSLQSRAAPAN